MCLFHKIKHSFALCLSTLYLSLVPERSLIVLSAFCEGIYQIPMLYPRKLCKFLEMIVCESVECSGKHSITLYPSLDPYRRTERWTETKYTRCAWAGGPFFLVVLLCQFLLWREISFGFTYLRTLLNRLLYELILF
jgi:hypothetical protein